MFLILKRIVIWAVSIAVVGVFTLFAINFYRHYSAGDGSEPKPTIIFEKPDRPPAA